MRPSLGIVGIGAFGEFMLPHLLPYFPVGVFDHKRDLAGVAQQYNVTVESREQVARRDIVILATPVSALEENCQQIKPYLRRESLVVDVSSVKVQTWRCLQHNLGGHCELLSLHPMFGPQSGKRGIRGMCVAMIEGGSKRYSACVRDFCLHLGTRVEYVSAEEHDREVAYIQGLTHLIANVFAHINPEGGRLSTPTYDLLTQSMDQVRYDSVELLRAIATQNPFVAETRQKFFTAVDELEKKLNSM